MKRKRIGGAILSSILRYPKASFWSSTTSSRLCHDIDIVFMQFIYLVTNAEQRISIAQHDKPIFPEQMVTQFIMVYKWLGRFWFFMDVLNEFISLNKIKGLWWCIWFLYRAAIRLNFIHGAETDIDQKYMFEKALGNNNAGDCHGAELSPSLLATAKKGIQHVRTSMLSSSIRDVSHKYSYQENKRWWWYDIEEISEENEEEEYYSSGSSSPESSKEVCSSIYFILYTLHPILYLSYPFYNYLWILYILFVVEAASSKVGVAPTRRSAVIAAAARTNVARRIAVIAAAARTNFAPTRRSAVIAAAARTSFDSRAGKDHPDGD